MERAFATVFGVDGVAPSSAAVEYAGRTDPVILEATAAALGIARAGFDACRPDLVREFLGALAREMETPDPRRRVLPGVVALLGALARLAHVRVALLTGNLEQGARIKLEPFELNGYFPTGGFSSDDPDRRGIARSAWRRSCEHFRIEFPPASVTVVGDTHHDVDCARANGFRAVAVASGWVLRERLEQARPDVLLDQLSAAPDVLEALGALPIGGCAG